MTRSAPNVPIALASLLLSVMLWFVVFVQNRPEPRPVSASLALDGLDEARLFVKKAPTAVRLSFNAPPDRLKDETITAALDLSGALVGTHDYPVVVFPAGLRQYLEDPHPRARVTLEAIDAQSLPVTSVVKGAMRDRNLLLKSRTLSPQRVVVRGPADEVKSVVEVRAYVDLAGIDAVDQSPQESELVPLDARGARPPHVRVTPSMAVSTFKLVAAEATKLAEVVPDLSGVSFAPGFIPDGYRLDPFVVNLRGKPAILANVSKVPTAVVRLRGLDRTRTARVRLLAPDGTGIVERPEADVTVRVRRAPIPSLPR